MLHLAGAEHGGRLDAFYPGAEHDPFGTRTSTCINWTLPNYAAGDTDSVAYLHYLWDPRAYRQMIADNGFENGFTSTWWILGGGAWGTENSSNPAQGSRRGWFSPTANSDSQSMQGRVRHLTGPTGDEKYRISAYVAPPASNAPTTAVLKLITRAGTYSGNNGCVGYNDGLNNKDPNTNPYTHPGALGGWTVVRSATGTNLPSGWTFVTNANWYDPPASDLRDFSVWLQGYADLPGTTAPGKILVDNLTIEGT